MLRRESLTSVLLATIVCACVVFCAGAVSTRAAERTSLPLPDAPFMGTIGLRASDSAKGFPAEAKAPDGAPNVLLIITDDVGFGATSTFGGPIPMPTFDRLANMGIRYNNFHTLPFRMSLDETLDIGEDTGTPVSEDYRVPFMFSGKLEKVTIQTADHKLTDEELKRYREGRLNAAMAQ